MRVNFHTHTKRCLHAYGSEEDYVKAALDANVGRLGFSDHAPFPDRDFGYRMSFEELDDHLGTIDSLKDRYNGQIQLYKGLEIEYHDAYIDYYRSLFEDHGIEYLALAEHQYFDKNNELKNIFFASSTEDYLEYAENLCKGMRTGLFAFAAHPDLMFLNDLPVDGNAQEACRMITECARENDIILEYNANGYRRARRPYPDGVRYPYPHRYFWEAVSRTDIRVIVGSDCHSPEQVFDYNVQFALREAEGLGLKLVDTIF